MRPYNQETVPMSPDPSLRGDLGLGTRLQSLALAQIRWALNKQLTELRVHAQYRRENGRFLVA